MYKQIFALTLALGTISWAAACGPGTAEGIEPDGASVEDSATEGRSTTPPFVEREFWLALAEEPGWHLNVARNLYLEGENERASMELGKVAAILNFESRHSHSPKEEGLLIASVQELREVAREIRYQDVPFERLPNTGELDRVIALTYRTIAAHQVALARDALEEGDALMAGRLMVETEKAIKEGFVRSGIEMGNALKGQLEHAREVAGQMELEGGGSPQEGSTVLEYLESGVQGLGEVLTSRRR